MSRKLLFLLILSASASASTGWILETVVSGRGDRFVSTSSTSPVTLSAEPAPAEGPNIENSVRDEVIDFSEELGKLVDQVGEPGAQESLVNLGRQWSKSDLVGVLQVVQQAESPVVRDSLFFGIVDSVGDARHETLLNYLESESADRSMRMNWTGTVLTAWAGSNLDSAVQWALDRNADPAVSGSIPDLLAQAAASDEVLAKSAIQNLEGDLRRQAILAVSQTIALEDRVAALEWLAELPSDQGRLNAFEVLVREWAYARPEEASAYVAALPQSPERFKAATASVIQWSSLSPETALEWVEENFDGNDARDLTTSVFSVWASRHPAQAAEFVDELKIDSFDYKKRFVAAISGNWGRSDPEAAMRWLASRESSAYEGHTLLGVASSWLNHDPEAARAWIDGAPQGEARDLAILALVYDLKDYHPVEAFQWATSMASKDRRNDAMDRALRSLADSQGIQAVVDMIESSPLEQAEKNRMLEHVVKNYNF